MFDEKELLAQMARKGLSRKQVANAIGIDPSTFYRKMSNDGSFKRKEILDIVELLDIEDPMKIFFASELAETQAKNS